MRFVTAVACLATAACAEPPSELELMRQAERHIIFDAQRARERGDFAEEVVLRRNVLESRRNRQRLGARLGPASIGWAQLALAKALAQTGDVEDGLDLIFTARRNIPITYDPPTCPLMERISIGELEVAESDMHRQAGRADKALAVLNDALQSVEAWDDCGGNRSAAAAAAEVAEDLLLARNQLLQEAFP